MTLFELRTSYKVMTIALARDVEAFLEEQVKSGACQNPSDLVNDALLSIRE